jgi:hypothetical protein
MGTQAKPFEAIAGNVYQEHSYHVPARYIVVARFNGNYDEGPQAMAQRFVSAVNQHNELVAALKGLMEEINSSKVNLRKLNVRKDFSMMNAQAYANKVLAQVEQKG